MYQPLYNETLCLGSEWGTKTSMHVEAVGTFRLDSGSMLEVPDTATSINVVTGIPCKEILAQCY